MGRLIYIRKDDFVINKKNNYFMILERIYVWQYVLYYISIIEMIL